MDNMQATFSVLTMSIASTALMAMGLAPNQDNKTEVDKTMARFNIDMLVMLREKTKNRLNADEENLLNHIIQDLQHKFLQLK